MLGCFICNQNTKQDGVGEMSQWLRDGSDGSLDALLEDADLTPNAHDFVHFLFYFLKYYLYVHLFSKCSV